MESYNSPVKVLNSTSINQWQCSFEPKQNEGVKLPEIGKGKKKKSSKIKFLTNKDPTRLLMVHEKGTFRTKTYRSRIPDVREMLEEIDAKVLKELGHVKVASTPIRSSQNIGTMTKSQYLQLKKNEFYANYYMNQMRLDCGDFVVKLERLDKQLQDQSQELYQDACAFNDFLKDTDLLCKQAKAYQANETGKLDVVRDAFLLVQNKSVRSKNELIEMDEHLSIYFSSKTFLLLVLFNTTCLPRRIKMMDEWKEFRKSRSYSRVFPAELYDINNKYDVIHRVSSTYSNATTKASRFSVLSTKKSVNHGTKMGRMPSLQKVKKVKSVKLASTTLDFLKEDVNATKIRFPAEWTQDATYSNTERDKIVHQLDDPRWFLDIIDNLKEDNLTIIMRLQSCDMADEMEGMKAQYSKVSTKYNSELDDLHERLALMQEKIDGYDQQNDEFEFLLRVTTGTDDKKEPTVDDKLEVTGKAITKVYHEIMGDSVKVDQITMLTKIEQTCYKYFDFFDRLGDRIFILLKKIGKKRRAHEFMQKEIQYQKNTEKKMKAAELRNLSGDSAFIGRKLVSRSQPRAKKSRQKKNNGDEEDLSYYFT